jgi:hypothetical protein
VFAGPPPRHCGILAGVRGAAMTTIELSAGPVEYTDTGGDGPVLVFVHGLMMDASL